MRNAGGDASPKNPAVIEGNWVSAKSWLSKAEYKCIPEFLDIYVLPIHSLVLLCICPSYEIQIKYIIFNFQLISD